MASALATEAVRARAELVRRQIELTARLSQLGTTPKVYAGTLSQPGPTHLLVRGDPTRKGPEVQPSTIAAIRPAIVLDPRRLKSSVRRHWRGGLRISAIRCRRE
jgi:hypothetical protein